MEFSNSFTVDSPLDRVWGVISDPQQVTPCVPGAQITEMVDETHFNGVVKVKLGAVQMSYRGTMEMQPNEAVHTLVLQGKGTATGGGGGASGNVTVQLSETDGGTLVEIHSQVDVTGRVAQFGRGIMQDVSNRLIKEFATCLQRTLSPAAEENGGGTDKGARLEQSPVEASSGETEAVTVTTPSSPVQSPAGRHVPASGPHTGSEPVTSELKLSKLLSDITRSKIAGGLRALAARIEPK